MIRHFPLVLLAVHLVYLLVLPSTAGRAVAATGAVVALALALGPVVSRRQTSGAATPLRRALDRRDVSVLLALACLPLLALVVEPRAAFWRVDGRALVILAWLAGVSWLLVRQPVLQLRGGARAARLPVLTQLFILWSALFWGTVVWDVGVGQAVGSVSQPDRLTTSFELWETTPARDHLYLVWLTRDAFDSGTAYTNHLHPFVFAMYGWMKAVQIFTGLPMYVGRNLTPFAMAGLGVLAFAALMPRPRPGDSPLPFHATLFVALGFLLTVWPPWVYPFTSNFDTVFPVIAYLTAILWSSARPRISRRGATGLILSAVLIAAFGWVYTPVLILALWCLFGRIRSTLRETLAANRPLVNASLAAATVGVATYALPILLVTLRGYDVTSSSLVFRAGLDGDTRYFQDAVQAVLHPFSPVRTWWSLLFPASVPLLIAAACAWSAGALSRRRFRREAIFLLAPYVFSIALFPQSVSIHPYLYDSLLVLPVVLMGATWTLRRAVQDRLSGATLLAALLLSAIVLMGNLIGIAQGMSQVPR